MRGGDVMQYLVRENRESVHPMHAEEDNQSLILEHGAWSMILTLEVRLEAARETMMQI